MSSSVTVLHTPKYVGLRQQGSPKWFGLGPSAPSSRAVVSSSPSCVCVCVMPCQSEEAFAEAIKERFRCGAVVPCAPNPLPDPLLPPAPLSAAGRKHWRL